MSSGEENMHVKTTVVKEAENVCNEIERLARKGIHTREFNARDFYFPNRVVEYLVEEYGYKAELNPHSHIIKVCW